MRFLLFLVLIPLGLIAQPSPPSFCFVLAEDRVVLHPLSSTSMGPSGRIAVVQHYRERVPYVGVNGSWLKPEEILPLQGGPLFGDSTSHWTVYHPREAMAVSFVLVIRGADTMRIDLPEDPTQLIDRAWARADRDTPEVIRFRKGRHVVEELVVEPWAVSAANTLAEQLIAGDKAMYEQQLSELEQYYRDQPPPAPPVPPYTPPPPMTEEDLEAYWAQQPPLKEAELDRVGADTAWVRLSGRVMLNGGCASGIPLFGIELHTDTGWVDRIPFELIQMDCGMPWADWKDHVVMLPPLKWWIAVHQPEGRKEMLPGSYRLFFVGGDMKRQWTAPFTVE